jgi:hypothetical protein
MRSTGESFIKHLWDCNKISVDEVAVLQGWVDTIEVLQQEKLQRIRDVSEQWAKEIVRADELQQENEQLQQERDSQQRCALKVMQENERLRAERDVLESSYMNAEMNLEHMTGLYEQLQTQAAKMVELPCKVGDTVYYIAWGAITETVVNEIDQDVKGEWWIHFRASLKCDSTFKAKVSSFGDRVFLTCEAAEKAIAEVGE